MSSSPQMSPQLKTIAASLKLVNVGKVNKSFKFDMPRVAHVKAGDQVDWQVTVSDKLDPFLVGVLAVFYESDSHTAPRDWPFDGPGWWKEVPKPADPEHNDFAIKFDNLLGGPRSSPFTVYGEHAAAQQATEDCDGRKVKYKYRLFAWIPKDQLPADVQTNSNDGIDQWPDVSADGGDEYLIVTHDPEMHVDEC